MSRSVTASSLLSPEGKAAPLVAFGVGAISASAFQPVGLWPVMIVCAAALLQMLSLAQTIRRAMLIGWLFGLGQFVIGLNWIATAFTFQAAMPAWLGWFAVVALSLYLAVYPMLAAGVAWYVTRKRPLSLVLAFAGTWAIAEWLRATMFTGFPWNPAGVVLVDTPLRLLSAGIGTYGLSAVVMLCAGALWLLSRRRWQEGLGIAVPIIAVAGALAATAHPAILQGNKPILIVQPDIGQEDKWRAGFEDVAAQRLDQLTDTSDAKAEMIFWPEAAVTDPLADNRSAAIPSITYERIRATRPLRGNDLLLTGGIGFRSDDGRSVDGASNSVFVLSTGGILLSRYDKAHLVPYGEYLPMRPILSAIGLSRLVPGDLDFQAGPGPRTVDLPDGWGKIGFQLCYEIIFSGDVVDRANRPDFIFNPSNDAWFGRWGPPQHLAQARLRAAEEGLPVIRSTPTGISALVDADGRLLKSIPWNSAGVIRAALPRPHAATLFARVGNPIPLTVGLLLLLGAIALGRRRR